MRWISCRGLENNALRQVERVGNQTVARFTGAYDLFGSQVYSRGQIASNSLRRFKGQQAAALILADVDPREHDLARELQVRFCGMTRGTVRLDILCRVGIRWSRSDCCRFSEHRHRRG